MVTSFTALQIFIAYKFNFGKSSKNQLIHPLLYRTILQYHDHDTKVAIY